MSGQASIIVAGAADERFSRELQATWSSLPASLAAIPGGVSLVAVDGRDRQWVQAATDSLRAGAGGVLIAGPVSGPAADDVQTAADLAAERGIPVIVESAWASHPALAPFASAAAEQLGDVALIDSVAVVTADDPRDSADVLLDHLALLRAASGPLHHVHFATSGAAGYTVNGAQDTGAFIALSSVRSATAEPAARLSIYGAVAQGGLSVPTDRGAAAPARAWLVDVNGQSTQPSWYESASRASWRRLLVAVHKHDTPPDLAGLAADIELAGSLAHRPPLAGDPSRPFGG
jgi:hypothetical protein